MEEEIKIQNDAQKYLNIRNLLEAEFDLSKLPVIADVKYEKMSGDK